MENLISRLFSRKKRQKSFPESLIGCWHLVFTEDPTIDPHLEVEFFADGRLTYAIQTLDGWEVMNLTWYVEKEFIVTDQASDRRVERTRFQFESDRTLVLTYAKYRSWYSKGSNAHQRSNKQWLKRATARPQPVPLASPRASAISGRIAG